MNARQLNALIMQMARETRSPSEMGDAVMESEGLGASRRMRPNPLDALRRALGGHVDENVQESLDGSLRVDDQAARVRDMSTTKNKQDIAARLHKLPLKTGVWPVIAQMGGLSSAYLEACGVQHFKHLAKADAINGLLAEYGPETKGEQRLEQELAEQENMVRNGEAVRPLEKDIRGNGNEQQGANEQQGEEGEDAGEAEQKGEQAEQRGEQAEQKGEQAEQKGVQSSLDAIVRQIAREESGRRLDEARVRQIAQEEAEAATRNSVQRLEVKVGEMPAHNVGSVHPMFETLLRLCNGRQPNGARLNVYMHGPAATGKTTAAKKVAEAMGLEFYMLSSLKQDYQVVGHMHGDNYVETVFRRAWERGGIILLDELDSFGANAALVLNGGLDSTSMAFPDGMVERHPDCIVIGAGNTVGRGGNQQYAGRARQDGAFLNRWVMLPWEHDNGLEDAICGTDACAIAKGWVEVIRACRKAADAEGLRDVQLTTRESIKGIVALRAGVPEDLVVTMVVRQGLDEDVWQRLRRAAGL